MLNQAFLDKLDGWPQIKSKQPNELRILFDFLTQSCGVCEATPDSLKILDFPSKSIKILSKLPMHFEIEWREIVYFHREKTGPCVYSSFDLLAYFIERRSKKTNIPELQVLNKFPLQTKRLDTRFVYKQGNKKSWSWGVKLIQCCGPYLNTWILYGPDSVEKNLSKH